MCRKDKTSYKSDRLNAFYDLTGLKELQYGSLVTLTVKMVAEEGPQKKNECLTWKGSQLQIKAILFLFT